MMKNKILFLFLLLSSYYLSSCSSDDDLIQNDITIVFSQSEYKVRKGKTLEIVPEVNNVANPIYSWKLNGKIISNDLQLTFADYSVGEYFITFRVDDEVGYKESQVKVTVADKISPEIEMVSSYIAYIGQPIELIATANYAENAEYVWRKNGEVVSEDKVYSFVEEGLGSFALTVKVTTEEGVDIKAITVVVLPVPEAELYFDDGLYRTITNKNNLRKMTVPLGKTLVLAPVICHINKPAGFKWTVDGIAQSSTTEFFKFTPTEKKVYLVEVTETGTSVKAQVEVTCTDPEGTYFRAVQTSSKAVATKAFNYIPAPGQFINYQSQYQTIAQVLQQFQTAVDANSNMYHIGAYGGYFVVGFDHSVKNVANKADLSINGNSFAGWSEPGVVWVMQDSNGNGLPDDTWYELKGSEYGKAENIQRYAITYYKPTEKRADVMWTDNFGNTGSVDINGYHSQDYFFPMFIKESAYTLTGTRVPPTFYIAEGTGYESSRDLGWGYVDNHNTDPTRPIGEFWIEDAIQPDGSPANLTHIDFVKVHTASVGKGTLVGEVSTEPGNPVDLNFNN